MLFHISLSLNSYCFKPYRLLGMVTRYKKNLSVAVQSSLNEKFVNMDQEYDSSFQDIIDENECLRKGMHEILDSIRNRDSKYLLIYIPILM